jgi:cation:H+ antiporter|tara:strand:- start:108 stop:1043 length:936 start_codon:yes stop_codon:yes gene_type:complete
MNLFFIFFGFLLLVIGGEFIVRSSVALSLKFNISKLVIGMTVVAFATSLPELIVSINAALSNSPAIAINNVIGSNIANIALVLSIISILSFIKVDKNFYRQDWPIMFGFSILLTVFCITDMVLNQVEGAILVVSLLFFIYFSLKKSDNKLNIDDIDDKLVSTSNTKIIIWLLISSVSLYFGAEFLVNGAVNFAKQINISEAVISVSIVAIGTSIPELAASLIAIAKKEKGISVGNLIGSNIFNIGSVLGITAIIKPIQIAQEIIERDIIWMLFFALLLLFMVILPRRNDLGKLKGFFMLLLYFVFITLAFI